MEKQKIRRSLSGILLLGIFFNFFLWMIYLNFTTNSNGITFLNSMMMVLIL